MPTSIPCEARIRLPSKAFSSRLDQEILALHLDQPRTHSPLGWSPKNLAGRHVELTPVARARHGGTVQLARRERAPSVGTCVIEGMKLSVNIRNVHLGAGKIKHAHLSRSDIFCVSNWYQHNFDFLIFSNQLSR
jgi:hypothetical protein